LLYEGEAGIDVSRFEGRVLVEDLLSTLADAQEFKDGLDRDPHSPDRGLAIANGGIDRDPAVQ
jgi:hypothetical protein